MKDYITQELAMLDRSIVATPHTKADLESFAKQIKVVAIYYLCKWQCNTAIN